MSDSEGQNKVPAEEGGGESDNSHDSLGDVDNEKGKKAGGKSQYEQDKEKNVAELQGILAELNDQYPLPIEVAGKTSKKQVAKNKQEKKEPGVRRESQRAKDKIRCLTNLTINALDTNVSSAVRPPFLMINLQRPLHSLQPRIPSQSLPLQLRPARLVSKIPQPRTLRLRQRTHLYKPLSYMICPCFANIEHTSTRLTTPWQVAHGPCILIHHCF